MIPVYKPKLVFHLNLNVPPSMVEFERLCLHQDPDPSPVRFKLPRDGLLHEGCYKMEAIP